MFPVSNVYDVMSFIKYADENESANGVERQNGNRNYKYVYIYICVCVWIVIIRWLKVPTTSRKSSTLPTQASSESKR